MFQIFEINFEFFRNECKYLVTAQNGHELLRNLGILPIRKSFMNGPLSVFPETIFNLEYEKKKTCFTNRFKSIKKTLQISFHLFIPSLLSKSHELDIAFCIKIS